VAIFGKPFLGFLHAHINSSINLGTPSQLIGSGMYCSTGNKFAFVRLDVSVYPAQTGYPPRITVVFLCAYTLHTHTHARARTQFHTHTVSYTHTHTHKYSARAEKFITCGISSRPGRTVHGGILQYPLGRRLGGAQSQSGSVGEGKGSNSCQN
jgi:hypothetical protein